MSTLPLGKFSYQTQISQAPLPSVSVKLGSGCGSRAPLPLLPQPVQLGGSVCFGHIKRLLFLKFDIELTNNWPEFSNSELFMICSDLFNHSEIVYLPENEREVSN